MNIAFFGNNTNFMDEHATSSSGQKNHSSIRKIEAADTLETLVKEFKAM
jgi:hypothetical protein